MSEQLKGFTPLSEDPFLIHNGFMLISAIRQPDGSFLHFGIPPAHIKVLPYGDDIERAERLGYEPDHWQFFLLYDPGKVEAQIFEGQDHLVVREKRRLESEGWRIRMDFSEGSSKLFAIRAKNLSSPKST